MQHSNKERDNVAESRPGSNTALVSSLNHLSWIISSVSIQFDVVYIHLQSTEKRCDVDKVCDKRRLIN